MMTNHKSVDISTEEKEPVVFYDNPVLLKIENILPISLQTQSACRLTFILGECLQDIPNLSPRLIFEDVLVEKTTAGEIYAMPASRAFCRQERFYKVVRLSNEMLEKLAVQSKALFLEKEKQEV